MIEFHLASPATRNRERAFTLVEMLVAMAVTLLMMAAVARGFAFIGERVRDSRATLQLSSELTDFTTRIRDELSRCTVNLAPNSGDPDQPGYFLYYEGPATDATSSLFRAVDTTTPADGVADELPDSRYGDSDDYLAFTAVAPPNAWFTGKVPRYVLDVKSVTMLAVNRDGDPMNNVAYNPANFPGGPFDPVVIRSKYAEIIYFASPEYSPASLPADPAYVDVDGDTDYGSGNAIENGFPDRLKLHRRVLLIRPDLNIEPNDLGVAVGQIPTRASGNVVFMQPDNWPVADAPSGMNPGTVVANAQAADGWLYGMAGVHQQCDLSVRRVLNNNGLPTMAVAANSLVDLSLPHNRFAHVRIPQSVIGSGTGTSMPVLALGRPLTVLSGSAGTTTMAPPLTPSVGPVVTPDFQSGADQRRIGLSGYLRPEFVLGNDFTHYDVANDAWGQDRIGEDLVVNNVLGFDLKIFDPNAPWLSVTNNLVVGPSDPGYREALIANSTVATEGGFVDLCYPVLAGGSIRGWQSRPLDALASSPSNTNVPSYFDNYLKHALGFGGLSPTANFSGGVNANSTYAPSLYESGRFLSNSTTVLMFQPAYDTFTSFYERDGFLQSNTTNQGTRWTTTTGANVDLGGDGFDNNNQFGPDDPTERETSSPVVTRAEAIQISLRLENPATRHIRQSSVVHRDH